VSGLLYTRAVALLGASTTALFTAAVPCITALAGIWLLDEIPSPMVWTGIACVTAGMMVAMYFGKPAARKPVPKQAPAKTHST
ncbi:MAG: EamA family transporter, partial [Burkholderiaceae bacterium]